MLKRFYISWFIYWGVYLLQPVYSLHLSTSKAFLYQFYFVAIVSIGYAISLIFFHVTRKNEIFRNREYSSVFISRLIKIGYVFSCLGLILLIIDKVGIQKINLLQSVAVIRDQWQFNAENRGYSVSSLYSAAGYLIGSSYYLCLIILFSLRYILPEKKRLQMIILGLFFLLMNSLLTGGRSGFLLLISLLSFSYFSNSVLHVKNIFSSRLTKTIFLIFFILIMIYSEFIFELRASRSNLSINEYIYNFIYSLGLQEYKFIQESDGWVIIYFRHINFILSYLTHSFATMAEIADYKGDSQNVLFLTIQSILSKASLMCYLPNDSLVQGRLASLPGLLLLAFKDVGLFIGAFVIGFCSNLANFIYKRRPYLILPLFLASIFESLLILSPFLFSWDLIFFPYAVFGAVITYLLARIKFKVI
jgi:hypothetical protein